MTVTFCALQARDTRSHAVLSCKITGGGAGILRTDAGFGDGVARRGESGVTTTLGRDAFAALDCFGAVDGSTARARFLPRVTVWNPSEGPGSGLAADSNSISDSESEPEIDAAHDAIDAGAGVGGDIGESGIVAATRLALYALNFDIMSGQYSRTNFANNAGLSSSSIVVLPGGGVPGT
ncbi:uncharacterized protein LOC134201846 [Bombyx mori]|uniref:uncharacterized protein LOC134201846 n=1 Tax=Bombyx mori TaxID=7091 RepID=UPI002ED2F6E1